MIRGKGFVCCKNVKTVVIIHTPLNYPIEYLFWMFACLHQDEFHTHTEKPAIHSCVFLLLSLEEKGHDHRGVCGIVLNLINCVKSVH